MLVSDSPNTTIAISPSLSEMMDDRSYLYYQRLRCIGSETGGIITECLRRMAAGRFEFKEGWRQQVRDILALERLAKSDDKKSPESKEARRLLRQVRHILNKEDKAFAGIRSTNLQTKNLVDLGYIRKVKHGKDEGFHVISQKKMIEKLDVSPTKVSIDADIVYGSFPNGNRLKFNATMTEVKLQFRQRGIAIGRRTKSRIERDGSRSRRSSIKNARKIGTQGAEYSVNGQGFLGRVLPEVISAHSGAAKLVGKSISTVRRHRRKQKLSKYNSGKIIPLTPGVSSVSILGHRFSLEVPFDRHSQMMWKDEMNQSKELYPYGAVIPYAGGVAIQESSTLSETKVVTKKGSGFYKKRAEKFGVPYSSRVRALATA